MSYGRRFLKLENNRIFLCIGMPFGAPDLVVDVTCVYHFAIGSEALANGDKARALEYSEKAGVDLLTLK